MKSVFATVIGSILLGLLVYAAIFHWKKNQIDERHAHLSSFEWFCQEFAVDGDARRQIETLHATYFPECKEHCVHYAGTREALAAAMQDPNLDNSPEHLDAKRKLIHLERDADKQFIDFVYRVADEMATDQSQRYRQRMKSWLERSSEQAPDAAGAGK